MAEWWKFHRVIEKHDGKHIGAPEGSLLSVIGIEVLCIFFCMGQRLIKIVYGRKLNNVKKI